jgi:hypothetical protein
MEAMDETYGDYSKTLTPDEYERYLVFRQRREQERLAGNLMHRTSDWVGKDPVPAFSERGMHKLLQAAREADARLETRIKKTKPMMTKTTTEMYNTQQLMTKLGVSQPTLNLWKHSGKIPESAVISPGIYKKSVIDDLFAEGALSKTDRVVRKRTTGGNNAANSPRSRTKGKPVHKESNPRTESHQAAEFWQNHAPLAARVLVLPEHSLPLVLECVAAAMKFMSEKQ